jgi:hypothetical protein
VTVDDEQPNAAQLHEKLRPLRTLYPDYSEAQLEEAYDNLRRYFDRAWNIFVRLRAEGQLREVFDKRPAASYDESQRSTHQKT